MIQSEFPLEVVAFKPFPDPELLLYIQELEPLLAKCTQAIDWYSAAAGDESNDSQAQPDTNLYRPEDTPPTPTADECCSENHDEDIIRLVDIRVLKKIGHRTVLIQNPMHAVWAYCQHPEPYGPCTKGYKWRSQTPSLIFWIRKTTYSQYKNEVSEPESNPSRDSRPCKTWLDKVKSHYTLRCHRMDTRCRSRSRSSGFPTGWSL